MPRGVSPSSSRRRHPFFWVAAAAVPLCAAIDISAAIAIWRYGPHVQSFGWTAAATHNGVIVASVEPGGAADGRLHPGDAIASVSTGVIPPIGFYRRAAPTDRPYNVRVASPRPITVELTAPVIRIGPLGRLLATFFSAVCCAVVGLFLGLSRPDRAVGRLLFLSLVGTGFVQLCTLDAFSDQLPRAGRLVNGALHLSHGITSALLFHAAVRLPGPAPPRSFWPGLGIIMYAVGRLPLPGRAFTSAVLLATGVACVSDRPGAPAVQTIEPGVLKVAVTNRSVSDPLDPEYWMLRYVERFGQELGLPIQWHVVPFDRSWELAGKDVVDLVATNVASFADRVSAGGTFSAPFLYERRALRIKASDTIRYRTIADFAGKRVGAVKGMAAERDLLKRAPPGVSVVSTSTFPELYEQFRDGRLDAVAQAEYYAFDGQVIPSYGPDIALIDHHDLYPGQREASVFIVRDKSRHLLDAINRHIAKTRFPL